MPEAGRGDAAGVPTAPDEEESNSPKPIYVEGVEATRSAFPALDRRQGSDPIAYFDGPGGTQVPRAVAEAMVQYLYAHNANTHWNYPTSRETDRLILRSREAFGDFLGVRADEVVFGTNMTSLTFHAARGLARRWSPGDEVMVTELDHHANVAPWYAVAEERGLVVRTLPMRPSDGTLEWGLLPERVGPKTRLIAIGAASNALGTVNDLAPVRALASDVGALVFVDAVHLAPHAPIDRSSLGADILVCSPYKFYGPHLGVLTGDRVALEMIEAPRLEPAPAELPERLETGTLSHEAIVGGLAGVDWIASLAHGAPSRRIAIEAVLAEWHARAGGLIERLWEGLGTIPRVRLFGPDPGRARTPTVGFVVDGCDSGSVAEHLASKGLFVSHGDFYAATVIERLGVGQSGLVRAGCACYTTDSEVERLVDEVSRISRSL